MADWTTELHAVVAAAPTIEEGVLKLVQLIHNEFHNGSGKNNPLGVADELLAAADDIVHAVVANTLAASDGVNDVVVANTLADAPASAKATQTSAKDAKAAAQAQD